MQNILEVVDLFYSCVCVCLEIYKYIIYRHYYFRNIYSAKLRKAISIFFILIVTIILTFLYYESFNDQHEIDSNGYLKCCLIVEHFRRCLHSGGVRPTRASEDITAVEKISQCFVRTHCDPGLENYQHPTIHLRWTGCGHVLLGRSWPATVQQG